MIEDNTNIWDNLDTAPGGSDFYRLDAFDSPLLMLTIIDEKIRNKSIYLYPWQIEILEQLGTVKPSSKHPYKFALCAANGSGKDAFIIAPFAVWFIISKIKAKVIITSASGNQLSTQTEPYIKGICKKLNLWYRQTTGANYDILKIRQRHITCLISGSEIFMFVTDEEGKAEGHHPTESDSEMAIIVNEAKNVTESIYRALRRCTGYNFWLDVSSPGEPRGDFYRHFQNWPNKKRVSYFDCLEHQSESEFEEDRRELGEHSSLFRSKHLALFTNIDGSYVVDRTKLEELMEKNRKGLVPHIGKLQPLRIGIDLALSNNGDESVVSIWYGNKQIAEKSWRIQNAIMLAAAIDIFLKNYVKQDHEYIFADDGGVGRPCIDILANKGWKIRRILFNNPSRNKKQFKNKGAQLWFNFARMIEEGLLIFKDTSYSSGNKLYEQIRSRRYKDKKTGSDILQLESKKEMIAEGFRSPDRADAAVLAFTGIKVDDMIKTFNEQQQIEETQDPLKRADLHFLYRHRREELFGPAEKNKHSYYSSSVLLRRAT